LDTSADRLHSSATPLTSRKNIAIFGRIVKFKNSDIMAYNLSLNNGEVMKKRISVSDVAEFSVAERIQFVEVEIQQIFLIEAHLQ
jgi:hypothetical protein